MDYQLQATNYKLITMARKTKSEQVSIKNSENIEKDGIEKRDAEGATANALHADVSPKNHLFNPEGELVVDVFETNSDFVVLATIAGIQIKDLDISVEKDMMVIKGNRENPHANADKKYFYQECYFGPFSRKIVLPENIHTEKASAEMDKGMLTIKIPKNGSEGKPETKTS